MWLSSWVLEVHVTGVIWGHLVTVSRGPSSHVWLCLSLQWPQSKTRSRWEPEGPLGIAETPQLVSPGMSLCSQGLCPRTGIRVKRVRHWVENLTKGCHNF